MRIRKLWTQVEETHLVAGSSDDGGPLRKVAAAAVIPNPFAGRGFVADLDELVQASGEIGALLGSKVVELLGAPVQSYGKGAIAGIAGEQEHANATLTSVFGDELRKAVGGGEAWITSATKVGATGCSIDVPLAYKDEIWIRSHYDAFELRIPDAPLPDEVVVIAVVTNRGRINARLGGRALDQTPASSGS